MVTLNLLAEIEIQKEQIKDLTERLGYTDTFSENLKVELYKKIKEIKQLESDKAMLVNSLETIRQATSDNEVYQIAGLALEKVRNDKT